MLLFGGRECHNEIFIVNPFIIELKPHFSCFLFRVNLYGFKQVRISGNLEYLPELFLRVFGYLPQRTFAQFVDLASQTLINIPGIIKYILPYRPLLGSMSGLTA